MNSKCTLLVNSCDTYSDVWDLFFAALRYQWPNCQMPIILNTETKEYPNTDGIEVFHCKNKRRNKCWGKRYKDVLKYIDTPYVFPVLEDYVLQESFTGDKLLERTMLWMDQNPDIGVFYLHKHPNVIQAKTEFDGFGIMPRECDYKLTTAVGVWRKEYLEKCIRGIESPWEWELFASKGARHFLEREYALLSNQKEVYVFPFGGVIWRGLWHPEAKNLAGKYDIMIDFTQRGFMNEKNPYRVEPVYSIHKHFPQDVFKRTFWQHLAQKVRSECVKKICEK